MTVEERVLLELTAMKAIDLVADLTLAHQYVRDHKARITELYLSGMSISEIADHIVETLKC